MACSANSVLISSRVVKQLGMPSIIRVAQAKGELQIKGNRKYMSSVYMSLNIEVSSRLSSTAPVKDTDPIDLMSPKEQLDDGLLNLNC